LKGAMSRASNTASVSEVAKLIRLNMREVGEDYSNIDVEVVINAYKPFLLDLVRTTPRPSKTLLVQALSIAGFPKHVAGNFWAQRMVDCVSYVKTKAKSMTSGVKLSEGVKDILQALRDSDQKLGGPPSLTLPIASPPRSSSSLLTSSTAKFDNILFQSPPPKKTDIEKLYCGIKPDSPAITAEILVVEDSPKERGIQMVDNELCAVVRLLPDGTKIQAAMREGPEGFALAKFESAEFETEIPNILMIPALKKRPAPASPRSLLFFLDVFMQFMNFVYGILVGLHFFCQDNWR